MPWSLKGHSIIANAWRKIWGIFAFVSMQNLKISDVIHQPFFAPILAKNIIVDLRLFDGLEKVTFQEFQLHMVIFHFDVYSMVARKITNQNRSKAFSLTFVCFRPESMTGFPSWNINFDSFSCKLQGLPTLRTTKNPSNSNSPKWMLLSTWKIFLPLPMHPGSYASSPNENRQGLHALHMALLLQNTNTIRSFAFTSFKKLVNFWRFGFFAETIATGQFFAHLATNFCVWRMLEFFVFFLYNWERWNLWMFHANWTLEMVKFHEVGSTKPISYQPRNC